MIHADKILNLWDANFKGADNNVMSQYMIIVIFFNLCTPFNAWSFISRCLHMLLVFPGKGGRGGTEGVNWRFPVKQTEKVQTNLFLFIFYWGEFEILQPKTPRAILQKKILHFLFFFDELNTNLLPFFPENEIQTILILIFSGNQKPNQNLNLWFSVFISQEIKEQNIIIDE